MHKLSTSCACNEHVFIFLKLFTIYWSSLICLLISIHPFPVGASGAAPLSHHLQLFTLSSDQGSSFPLPVSRISFLWSLHTTCVLMRRNSPKTISLKRTEWFHCSKNGGHNDTNLTLYHYFFLPVSHARKMFISLLCKCCRLQWCISDGQGALHLTSTQPYRGF